MNSREKEITALREIASQECPVDKGIRETPNYRPSHQEVAEMALASGKISQARKALEIIDSMSEEIEKSKKQVWIAEEYLKAITNNKATGTSHFAKAINSTAEYAQKALEAIKVGELEPGRNTILEPQLNQES